MPTLSLAPERCISTVLVGVSGKVGTWLPALLAPEARRAGVALEAVCCVDSAAEGALPALGNGTAVVHDLDEALARGPDLVVDCTSIHARPAIAGAALRVGAHVLCEPPLAADASSAIALIGAAARAPGSLTVAYAGRHRPDLHALRPVVRGISGTMVRRLSVRIVLPETGPLPVPGRAGLLSNGPVGHAIDAVRALTGREAIEVRCRQSGRHLAATFALTDGMMLDLSVEPGKDRASGSETWTCEADGNRRHLLRHDVGDATPSLVIGSVAAALRDGRHPEPGPRDAAGTLAMLLAAERSAGHEGRSEPVPPLGLMGDASGLPAPRGGLATRTRPGAEAP
ncbi:Gfo/Idh/MocA family protein [Rubellimicrobium sp. CFH 75288]|uniref:Gfo/Idh/MocA family protein n=1 Tax=Rubellimicrobium sp. CFH 75288 TaxID=2697034 RepID=UPI00141298DA|nr:Gfo/Idh/MocA family oxidoreductase [Rubellimicrobium sp. CFH 75288]NAZ35312.1 Gfo/Idh/MocA family oxidoreductase [Rubellimicrobium sp. CFH 75288]